MGSGEVLNFIANRSNSGKCWCSVENRMNTAVNASALLDVQCKYKNAVVTD